MRRYSILHPFWLSFYSGDLYEDVGRNWGNVTFLYLLVLLAATWIPIMPGINEKIQTWIDASARKIVEQIPEITIEDGRLSVDAEEPVIINDPDTDKVFMIIDVTGQYTSLDDTEASMLVTETEIMVRQNGSKVRTYPIPSGEDVERIVINRDTIYQWLDVAKNVLGILLYPVLVVASYVYRIIQVIVYGLIGRIFVQHFKAEMEFPALARLSVIAITPAVILDTIHSMMDVSLPFWWPICFVLSMGYLYFGIKVNVFGVDEP